MDKQIDEFNEVASLALLQLYRVFPRQHTLYVDELIGLQELDEYGLPRERHQRCLGTLLWLGDEGYLRHNGLVQYEALEQAVLSEKGLLRLTTIPTASSLLAIGLTDEARGRTLAQLLRVAVAQENHQQLAGLARLLFMPASAFPRDTV